MPPLRILLVDDNEAVRRGIRTILSSTADFSICGEAADGIEAIEKARALRPDAILLDILMPRMDGLQAGRAIRSELPDAKVIMVSQNDPQLLRRQAEDVGATAWIAKIDLPEILLPTIEKAFAARIATQDGQAPQAKPAAQLEPSSLPWLPGGGEMGAIMRDTDWSTTVLGPADSWSPALRMMVKFLVANRFPQLLWWGPRFACIYNDAYIPILGAKHPASLGRPVKEVWSEIWHILQPLIETPYHGGPATWMEDIPLEINRLGFTEETHFTIAYSAVPDDSVPGGIGGVIATVHEITQKVIAERRVLALRDLAARAVEPKSAEEACTIAAETLARFSHDVPFALMYLLDEGHENAHLVCGTGVSFRDCRATRNISLADASESAWPLAKALETGQIQLVRDVADKFEKVPQGPWSDPPSLAAVVPIRSTLAHSHVGFMVVGISSRTQFDANYNDFLLLLSYQIATSITNARAYAEERKRAEALAEIDRVKTAFFSNVSHEFRTPLTLMLGPVQDLLSRSESHLSPTAKEHLELVNRNGARLLRLVNTLLDFSRIEAGRTQAVYQATDLASFTADLASSFRSATEPAGLKLIVDCRSIGEPVYIDIDMWEKIILNLVSNAFKFTFEGEIAVTLSRVDDLAELRVRDTGVGIPAEAMPRLFDRFHRVPNTRSRSFEGSGIGLALVQELVKLHGGSVQVESALGHGSTFIVNIPLGQSHLPANQIGGNRTLASTALGATPFVEEALHWLPNAPAKIDDAMPPYAAAATDPLIAPEHASAAPSGSRPRVIIADDNSDMRQYLVRLLADRYDIEPVSDGAAALAAARRNAPDLILSDVMMPNLDGLGLVRELRADPTLKETPIVLLSARAGEESRIEGVEAGADAYLVKPFHSREVVALVDAQVKMHRMREEARQQQAQLIDDLKVAQESYRHLAETLDGEVRLRTSELENRNTQVLLQSETVRDFSQRLMQMQDQERRRIARELHDSSGQILTILGLEQARIAEVLKDAAPELAAKMQQVQDLTQQLTQDLRTTSYLLHPPLLDETGIAGALQWYLEGFTARSGIHMQLEIDPNFDRLPPEIELSIFRIVQEAITNVHRHSGAKGGVIRIERREDQICVEVRDHGKGMPPARLSELRAGAAGVGLRGMRERVNQFHGEISLDSDSSGTTLRATFPIPRPTPLAATP